MRLGPRRRWHIDGVSEFLGFKYEGPGRIRVTVRPDLLNPAGLLSGVVAFGMIDYAMGSALWQAVTEEEGIATLNIALNYVATAREGDIVCTAHVDRRTRTNAMLRAEVLAEDERLVATAVGTFAIFPRRPAP
jgi:uncharacterized protein (TIGR00369 family)